MVTEHIIIRDRRGGHKFIIDNSVYDMGLSCEAMTMYCGLARYAHRNDERPYFSMRKFMTHHKIGKVKAGAARKELIEKKLVRVPKERHESGAWFFELLQPPRPPEATVAAPPEATVAAPPEATVAAKQYNLKQSPKSNNNTAGEPAPLYSRVVKLIGDAHKALTGEELSWIGYEKAYGAAVKQIIAQAEGPKGAMENQEDVFGRIRVKVEAYFRAARAEVSQQRKFYTQQGITPLSLRSAWNRLVTAKGQSSMEPTKDVFPDVMKMTSDEISNALSDWQKKFTIGQVREGLPKAIWDKWQAEKNGFAGALCETVLAYVSDNFDWQVLIENKKSSGGQNE